MSAGQERQLELSVANVCHTAHERFASAEARRVTDLSILSGIAQTLSGVKPGLQQTATSLHGLADDFNAAHHAVEVAKVGADTIGSSANQSINQGVEAIGIMHAANLDQTVRESHGYAIELASYAAQLLVIEQGLQNLQARAPLLFESAATMMGHAALADQKMQEGAARL